MAGSGFAQIIPLILIFVIFYFFLIRPQQKKVKEHKIAEICTFWDSFWSKTMDLLYENPATSGIFPKSPTLRSRNFFLRERIS